MVEIPLFLLTFCKYCGIIYKIDYNYGGIIFMTSEEKENLLTEEGNELIRLLHSKNFLDLRGELKEFLKTCHSQTINDYKSLFEDLLGEYGMRNISELELIIEIIKALNMDNQDRVFTPKFTDTSHSDSLDMKNANACIRSIKRNLIPVLVGEAGCGKTYTAEHLGEKLLETFGKEGQVLKQTKICCSGIPYNEFWGSYDAVSHMCTGSFKYIWKEAENNSDILYYVILDEMLDMTDIRQTFGGAFADLDNLPNNLFIVATGNNGVWEAGGVTYNKMLNDDGIDQNRFNLIPVHNIFEDLDSAEAQLYLSSFDKDSERFKDIMKVVTSDASKVLSPRKFRNMMQLSDEEYKEDIEFGLKRDDKYKERALLVDRPKYEK